MPHDERSVSQFGSTYYSLSDIYFYLNKKSTSFGRGLLV